MKLSERLNFRVTVEEKKRIHHRSHLARMSTSNYCRNLVLDKEIVVIEGLADLIYELNKIGGNVNQMAYFLNSGKVQNVDLMGIRSELNKVLERVCIILESGEKSGNFESSSLEE